MSKQRPQFIVVSPRTAFSKFKKENHEKFKFILSCFLHELLAKQCSLHVAMLHEPPRNVPELGARACRVQGILSSDFLLRA